MTPRSSPVGAGEPPPLLGSACSDSSAPAISVTTARWKSVLNYLRTDHPEAVIDAMCPGPKS